MLSHYFSLQANILSRRIRASGLEPWFALLLLSGLLAGGSFYLFSKTDAAGYFISIIALGILTPLSAKERNDFLRVTLPKNTYLKIRFLENGLLALPFLFILLGFQQFIPTLILLVGSTWLTFQPVAALKSTSRKSPFGKHPFEFASGIRMHIFLFLAVSLLLIPAIMADNASLGVFVMGMYFVLVMPFYTSVENEILVWIHHGSPRKFLRKKIAIACFHMLLLLTPIALTLSLLWPQTRWIVLLILLCGFILLTTIVLAKYAAFPNAINVPEGIVIAVSITFPPLLPLATIYFYKKAKHQLQFYLHDTDL